MVVMPVAEDYGSGRREVHTCSGSIGFEDLCMLTSIQQKASFAAISMTDFDPEGETMFRTEGGRDIVVYQLGYFNHIIHPKITQKIKKPTSPL